ncbi:MSC_0623 family F1-like ATPase-associated protein [Mycoplasmopsis edwardii]|uniref:DUF2714 domain-containing protein n=2 Tax=Mycoplasmopsis edwardii TaxID=53558 RepID=A0ACD4PIK3_9BACT|nr:DUF2714 domain-containing protein [Mycoplasmopsis edwardii]WBP83843.1 DUF2714 domain-containing protein [Mycoplasmopsis edwardii]SYV97580.1 Protein of uncharacterised function (DUF2714) [Mycoplasmopsis edwardii]
MIDKITFFKRKNENKEPIFDLYKNYNNLINENKDKLISFETLMSKPLLVNNLGFSSNEFNIIKNRISEAIDNKYNLIFDEFTITFNLNLKYSQSVMIPMIANELSLSDNYSINFSSSDDYEVHKLLRGLNDEIGNFLHKGYFLEIIPNTILFYESDSLKLFFSKDLTVKVN